MKKIIVICALLLALCIAAAETDAITGTFEVDMKQYAADEGVSYADTKQCSSTWTFGADGSLHVELTTVSPYSEALSQPTTTQNDTTFSISEKVECVLEEESVYTVEGDNLLWNNGVVMGSIKSNKTSKGSTTIKLDTPNGGSKTLKGTLSEDGITFTINNSDNKMSATYSIKDGTLVADKGVVLGTITARSTADGLITLTLTAPDGSSVEYTGTYTPELKIGSVAYSYSYTGNTLIITNTKHTLTLVRVNG